MADADSDDQEISLSGEKNITRDALRRKRKDMYEPSKSAGFVDIQDGDAISESSDTEIVAHTEEQVRYDNNASSGDDDSDNDDNDINHGPPPLDSDDDEDSDDDDDVQGPPTDDGDKVLTAPAVGGSEALSSRRTVVSSEKRDSPGSDSESDSDGDGKEAPPPLDSEEEGGGDEEAVEEIEPVVEKKGFVSVANESSVHNLAVEHINMQYENDDDETRNLDSDYEDHGGSDHDIVSDGSNHDEAAKESQEDVENVQASLHSLHVRNSDESEHSDSAGEVKGEMEAEKQESGTDEGDDYDSDQRVELDSAGNAPGETIIAAGESSDILSDNDTQDDEPKDAEETKIHEDAIEEEQREKQSALLTSVENDHDEMSSEKECNASFQFVPDDDDDDENELEWDVEDFDIPKRKNAKKTRPASKIDPEGAEVEKLKKSFMDTLRSEAEQAKVVEATQKTGSNKKKKLNKVINSNSRNIDQGQEKREVETKPVKPVHEVRRVPGTARRTKETSPNVGHAKDEKKTIKGETNIAAVKVSDSATKALRTKSKAVDSTVGQRDVHKVSKQRKGVMETQKTSKVSERMPEGKPSKVKSSSVSSLSTGDSELKASQKGKESKKAKPVGDVETDLVPQRTEIVQKQKGERKARKSDSDNSLDSSTSSRKKAQKAATSGSDSKPRKSNAANSQTHKRVENTVEREERKQLDSKQASVKSVYAESYHEDGYRLGNADNNVKPTRNKPQSRPKSNGHSSSSYETLSVHAKRHDHGTRNHEVHHRHSDHVHERGKHVWLCRDDEIHKLIAQKASLLKEYESGSFAGRRLFSGHKSQVKRVDEPADVPDVGFVGRNKQTRRHGNRPLSEAIFDRTPYSSQRKDKRLSLRLDRSGSSSDEDERTNAAAGSTRGGTFAVGLAARNKELKGVGDNETDHEETCEYCAAEKAAAAAKAQERNPAWEGPHHPRNLLLGVVYSAKYLGSSQIMSPQSPNKAVRMEQAQEALGRIKVPEGEEQPTTDIDLFISTERLKIVNSSTKEVMLDHALRTVSFIADIGDVLVLMARNLPEEHTNQVALKPTQILATVGSAQTDHKNIKITCHVFQSAEAQVMAKSIGQAFNVAYQEFLRQNGLSDEVVEEAEYNGVLEAQKILGEDLSLLSDENSSKEVIVNKKPHEYLGVMIVESGWGSMIPCAIVAHLAKEGPAAKSGRLNVGDQILSVNGTSLVGLPLLECQNVIKGIRPNTKVVLKIVSCPPTVQVVVNRPDTKYQLGFSVQNGMICSLMRGSIAERGGVRVGHRIIEINDESVVATSHQHIVELLATTVGEIRMKTMPASMYRLLVGLETPQHI
ncbi:enolase-phosphatase E1-like isoform X2 [Acropora muricata]|uniref:enolase-phosphatase E1-like isoform X2 n=1 Tax=Acropora muricata TaxID=159855 RepID=UPI0034E56600